MRFFSILIFRETPSQPISNLKYVNLPLNRVIELGTQVEMQGYCR